MSRRAVGWTWVVVQLMLLVAFIWTLRDWHGVMAAAIGTGALVLGGAIGVTAARDLGTALTPTPVPRTFAGLHVTGIYRWVRHPIYTALLLAMIGLVVAFGTWWSGALWCLALAFFAAKARWEDTLLRATYGDEWVRWAERTPALLPRRPQDPSAP